MQRLRGTCMARIQEICLYRHYRDIHIRRSALASLAENIRSRTRFAVCCQGSLVGAMLSEAMVKLYS